MLEDEAVAEELIHEVDPRGRPSRREFTPVLHGHGLQEQGRAAAAGRRGAAICPSPLDRTTYRQATTSNEGAEDRRSTADPGQAARGAWPSRSSKTLRPADLHAHLPGHDRSRARRYFNTAHRPASSAFSRIVRMHADEREEIDEAEAGDIVAVLGVDCASGDTFCSTDAQLHAGKHVRARAGHQAGRSTRPSATARPAEQGPAPLPPRRPDVPRQHRRGDRRDDDRRHGRAAPGNLRRAHPPRVQRRGRGRRAEGQLPRGAHRRRPSSTTSTRSRPAARASTPTSSAGSSRCPKTRRDAFEFEDDVVGGRIPNEYIPSFEKGFRVAPKGPVAGYRVVGVKIVLEDGSYHDVD